jgi:hypothetical protein
MKLRLNVHRGGSLKSRKEGITVSAALTANLVETDFTMKGIIKTGIVV